MLLFLMIMMETMTMHLSSTSQVEKGCNLQILAVLCLICILKGSAADKTGFASKGLI